MARLAEKFPYFLAPKKSAMSTSRTRCAGSLTRCVTIIVLIQCCLVLVYITFTQTSSSSSRHPSRQPRASSYVSRDVWRVAEAPSSEAQGTANERKSLQELGMRPDVIKRQRIMNGAVWHKKHNSEDVVLADSNTLVFNQPVNASKAITGNQFKDAPPPGQEPIFLDRSVPNQRKLPPIDSSQYQETQKLQVIQEDMDNNRKHDSDPRRVDFVNNNSPDLDRTRSRSRQSRALREHSREYPEQVLGDTAKVARGPAKAEEIEIKTDRHLGLSSEVVPAYPGSETQGNMIDSSRAREAPNLFSQSVDIVNHPAFPEFMAIPDDKAARLWHHKNGTCLLEGTSQLFNSRRNNFTRCVCRPGWHGQHCGIPDSVMLSEAGRHVNSMTLRTSPRRIINAIAFNVEFELLEARLHELGDTVDLYILHESNYTNYGTAKPLRLLQRLRQGYLREYHHKFVYLYRGDFPSLGRVNGWVVDQSQRTFISVEGLKLLRNVRDDDIFIYTDTDEIPAHDALLFLKMHDGYPEPFGFSLRWSVFGFYWKQPEQTRIMAGCSVKLLQTVFQNDIFQVRSHNFDSGGLTNSSLIDDFVQSGGVFHDWLMAEDGGFAGWHCSWCLSPEGVRVKLKSAINADFPRWGNFPEKLDISYIRKLITTGTWFDDQTRFSMVTPKTDPHFAPKYAFQDFPRFRYLLDSSFYQTTN